MRELFSRRLKNYSRIILEWTIKEEVVILKSITSTGIWNQFKDQVLDFMPPLKQTHPKPTKLWVGKRDSPGKIVLFLSNERKNEKILVKVISNRRSDGVCGVTWADVYSSIICQLWQANCASEEKIKGLKLLGLLADISGNSCLTSATCSACLAEGWGLRFSAPAQLAFPRMTEQTKLEWGCPFPSTLDVF